MKECLQQSIQQSCMAVGPCSRAVCEQKRNCRNQQSCHVVLSPGLLSYGVKVVQGFGGQCCAVTCCAVSCVLQLLGVALVAVQGGLGEASALGLCSLHPNQLSLTAWSSGTGFAGAQSTRLLTYLHIRIHALHVSHVWR